MAQAFPNSPFTGFDYHAASIECARKAAEDAGVPTNVSFEVASAKAYPGTDYDLVAFFDCLHDMGDPVGAARTCASALDADGDAVMLVEPFAHDNLADNLNPVGRDLLCRVDDDLHAGLAGAGGRPGSRSAGGRGAATEVCTRPASPAFAAPPKPVQPGPGSPALAAGSGRHVIFVKLGAREATAAAVRGLAIHDVVKQRGRSPMRSRIVIVVGGDFFARSRRSRRSCWSPRVREHVGR